MQGPNPAGLLISNGCASELPVVLISVLILGPLFPVLNP